MLIAPGSQGVGIGTGGEQLWFEQCLLFLQAVQSSVGRRGGGGKGLLGYLLTYLLFRRSLAANNSKGVLEKKWLSTE